MRSRIFRLRNLCSILFTCWNTFFIVRLVEGTKLRTWLGPDKFFEGLLPTARNGHGVSSTEDGNLFVFAGSGNKGVTIMQFFALEYQQ